MIKMAMKIFAMNCLISLMTAMQSTTIIVSSLPQKAQPGISCLETEKQLVVVDVENGGLMTLH